MNSNVRWYYMYILWDRRRSTRHNRMQEVMSRCPTTSIAVFESPLDPSLANYSLLGRERWRTLAELTSVDDGFPLSVEINQNWGDVSKDSSFVVSNVLVLVAERRDVSRSSVMIMGPVCFGDGSNKEDSQGSESENLTANSIYLWLS